jgi:uncharacterized protein involved in exopolysaccharide biosynthesis
MPDRRTDAGQEVKDLLTIAWRRKWLVIIPLILVGAATLGGSYYLSTEWESSAIVQIDPQIQLTSDLERLVGRQTGFANIRAGERGYVIRSIYNEITSTYYTSELNDRMALTGDPDIEKVALQLVAQQPEMSIGSARLNVLQQQLKNTLAVEWASGDQIEIRAASEDPLQARDIANNLAEIFIEEKVKQELNQIRSSQNFSDIQLEKYEEQLQELIRQRTNLEKEMLAIQLDESITSESNRSEISAEIDRTLNEIQDLRTEEKDLLSSLGGVQGLSVTTVVLEDADEVDRLSRELNRRLGEVGDLMTKYTWSDPQVLNFKVRQNNFLNQISQEHERLVDRQFSAFDRDTRERLTSLFDTRIRLAYLYSKRPYLQSALDDINAKMTLIPDYQARLTQLDREISAATDIRDRFRRQQESSTISQALVQDLSSTKYRIVEPAKLALEPSKPNRTKIVLMGLMLGLVIGGAAAVLVELLDNTFKRVDDVEDSLDLKVIGVVPRMDFLKNLP